MVWIVIEATAPARTFWRSSRTMSNEQWIKQHADKYPPDSTETALLEYEFKHWTKLEQDETPPDDGKVD